MVVKMCLLVHAWPVHPAMEGVVHRLGDDKVPRGAERHASPREPHGGVQERRHPLHDQEGSDAEDERVVVVELPL